MIAPPTAIDLLVEAEFLYPMTSGAPIVRGGEVAIANGRIVHAGPAKESGHWAPRRVLHGAGKAVLPGFVNAHCHAGSTVFRSQTDDQGGGAALYTIAFRMEKEIGAEEWRDLAWLGCLDMVKAGITTLNDIWYAPEALAEAAEVTGLRADIANKVFDVRLEELHHGDYTRHREIGAARLRAGIDFAERWHGGADGRIRARLGTHASDTCAEGLHREARAEADRLGIGMHMHTAQAPREVAYIREAHGKGPLEYLRDIGLLQPDVVCAHLTFASDGDLDAVKESGAAYAHCPIIYARRGSYPRLREIFDRGIPTGFATDWMTNDPFEGMRNAINATRVLLGDPGFLPCEEALRCHTIGSARALGLDAEIGSLAPGKRADLIMVDLDRPHLQPFYGGYPALVFYAKASDVVTSIVDGRVVMEDRRLVGVDEEAILAAVKRRVPRWSAQLKALGSGSVVDPCGC
jgi:5-methylthioadenosine/S-adenosylhomocysteine deaminase